MKASILDLRRRMQDVLKALERNEKVTLTHRGVARGVIYPSGSRSAKPVSDHAAFGMWRDRDDMKSVDRAVDNLRKGRTHAL